MKLFRQSLFTVCVAAALSLGACGTGPMTSTSTALTARLGGSSEVPAIATEASGTVEATLAAGSNVLRWKVTYAGLSGVVTAAHFHGPASPGQNAGVVVPVSGSLTSPIVGSATLTPGQVDDLRAGRWYVNLHTAAHPDGEARGQMGVRP